MDPLKIDIDRTVNGIDPEWDRFVASHPQAHILQTNAWGRLKSDFGWQSRLVLLRNGGEIAGGAQLLLRSVMGLKLAYVPRGPVVDWNDTRRTAEILEQLAEKARAEGAVLLKIEPELTDSDENRVLLSELGLRPGRQTIQPRSTIHLAIDEDPDTILAKMKSKWRYNIRLAGRKGVTVRPGGATDLDRFESLMEETGERNDFSAHSIEYYRRAFDLFVPENGVFLFAEYEGVPLAAIVVLAIGDKAWYLWGASSNRERNRMPNHGLQWAAIEWARARGCSTYDFWGVPDEIGQIGLGMGLHRRESVAAADVPLDLSAFPQGDLWGVFRFKQGFGGDLVRYVGAWDYPLYPLVGSIYDLGLDLMAWRRRTGTKSVNGQGPAKAPRSEATPGSTKVTEAVAVADDWRAHLAQIGDPHVLQSWEWGELKSQTGWRTVRRVLRNDVGDPESAFQFLWRAPISGTPLRIGYVPKGPLADWDDELAVDRLLGALEDECRRQKCLFVKIDPNFSRETVEGRRILNGMRRRGWRPSAEQIQFPNSALTDLDRSADELLASFKSKWRYNIRLAERRGVTVRQGDETDLALFYHLYRETGERDQFLVRPFEYYASIWNALLQAQQDEQNPLGGALFLAEHPDENAPLAGLFLFRYADTAWYFYGASSARRRRDMPNYLLQWRAMRWAQEQGCRRYDWWGAPSDPSDGDDPLAGVWRFKQGFDAQLANHPGAWDWSPYPSLWRLYQNLTPLLLDSYRRVSVRMAR